MKLYVLLLLLSTVYSQENEEPTPGWPIEPTITQPTRSTVETAIPTTTTLQPAPSEPCGCELHFCGHGVDEIWLDMTECCESCGNWTEVCSETTSWQIPIECTLCVDTCCNAYRVRVQKNGYVNH